MGTLTFEQFRNELVFDLRNRTDRTTTEGVSDDRLNMWINAGYLHICHPTVFRHRELQYSNIITLVAGQQSYTFTPVGGTVIINAVRYVTHVAAASDSPTAQRTKLLPRDEQWFQTRVQTTGAPREYFIRANQILVGPVPTAAEAGEVLVMGTWREPELLSTDISTTSIGNIWDEVVLLAARWRAELHLGYRDLAEATKLDFVSLINEYKDFEHLHGEDWDWQSPVLTDGYMETA